MHRYTLIKFLPALLLLGGCLQDLLNEGDGLVSLSATEAVVGSTSTGEPPTPTTSAGLGVQTVTGDEDSTGPSTTSSGAEPGSSSGDGVNLPPTIELFDVKQDHLSEAGPAELQLIVSADVVKVKLSLDGKELAKNLKPGDFPRSWDAFSAKDNGDKRVFEVVVEDAEGLTATDTTELSVLLPQSGVEKCLFQDQGANASVISALKYTPDAIIAVGSRDTGAGLRMTAWKLDPDHCEVVLPGWPKTIASWTPALEGMTSLGAAVDVDEDGNIIVAGNLIVGGKPQSYVALLNEAGARLWEKLGQVGDEVAGVAAATAQFKNRVFVVGSQRTSDVPVRTDAAIWTYMAIDGVVSVSSSLTLNAPFTPDESDANEGNKRSERVHAVVIQPGTGNALAVGEREFKPEGFINIYSRAFTVLVHPLGGIVGTPWTSQGTAYAHDSIRSVGICGGEFVAGGWTRDVPPDATPQPIIFWPGTDQHRHLPQLGGTQVLGIACDREDKIVSAGTRASGTLDAQVFTVTGLFDPPTWYETGVAGDDGSGAVACDWRGFCGWGGYRTANGKLHAVVRVHHP